MAGTFICPDCGRETEKGKFKNRKICPECAHKRKVERQRIAGEERRKQEKEIMAFRHWDSEVKKERQERTAEQLARDAEIDARSAKQIKLQCRFCKYRLRSGQNGKYTVGCDYISWKEHSTDKGNGVGDCRSFEPDTKETKAERTARRKRAIRISEANNAKNTGEKMREVNQL